MTIARTGLKVTVMGQANAVGPTLIEGSFSSLSYIDRLRSGEFRWTGS